MRGAGGAREQQGADLSCNFQMLPWDAREGHFEVAKVKIDTREFLC